MEEVQSIQRPLAYQLAKLVASPKENQIDSSGSFNFTGTPEAGLDMVYDF
jgi:hypothetical protein